MQAVERRWINEGFPDARRIEELVSEAIHPSSSSART
jgi:hypothetical protein